MMKYLALTLATAALADIGGDPVALLESEIYGENWAATVRSSVYTENEQQDQLGLPDGSILITYTIQNSEESLSEIEDVDIFVGTKSEENSHLSIPGYFQQPTGDENRQAYNAPDFVDFAYETGLYNWDWGAEGNFFSSGLKPGEYATLFVISWTDGWIESPGIVQGGGDAGLFFAFVPEIDGQEIPAPGTLTLLGLSIIGNRSRRRR
jgi:hypothetical protein